MRLSAHPDPQGCDTLMANVQTMVGLLNLVETYEFTINSVDKFIINSSGKFTTNSSKESIIEFIINL